MEFLAKATKYMIIILRPAGRYGVYDIVYPSSWGVNLKGWQAKRGKLIWKATQHTSSTEMIRRLVGVPGRSAECHVMLSV